MLIWFVVCYLLVSVGIGLYASTRVHNSRDFVVAGRNLPLPIVTATVFATWFGAETVLGISATFVKEGLAGVVADPFGASLCLVIAGLFFAPLLYRMNLLTIGDYYRARYNRAVELIMTVCIMISYLGWVSAQVVALGLVFNVVSDGAVTQQIGMVLGISVVLTYTIFGGMWSVALLDFVQMTVIMAALLLIAVLINGDAGGVGNVVSHAQAAGKLQLFPSGGMDAWIPFIGAALTMMLGSIPQQDVFQRMTSAKDEKTAVRGSVSGGLLYFGFAFIPMFLAYSATLIDPKVFGDLVDSDSQMILPSLILNHTPLVAQVLFFGALLSAIMSTASATLLAPSVMFTENILKHFALKHMSDQQMLRTMRIILITFGGMVLWFALHSESSIFHMVENAYKVTLVGAFVPLAFGLYWKRANNQGALLSIALGLGSWLLMEVLQPDTYWPPQLIGLLFSICGMLLGSTMPNLIGKHGVSHHHQHSST
ncbi:MAG: sodium:solute symporter family protein [Sideroxydans sp.]|nr:sodium:solute symporter family protein [Sideroxydans sp.]